MPYSRYPHGFSNGVSIEGVPFAMIQNANGHTYWVDSAKGSNGNRGTEISPFATVTYAISRCTANQGDIIYVAPGHAETIVSATGFVCDIAGVTVIGLGEQLLRPTFTFTTATAASVVVSAANVMLSNLVFICNIASQVTMIDCNSTSTTIDSCQFKEGSATGLTFIDINGGGANACDEVKVSNCDFFSATDGNYTGAIELGEVANKVIVDGCTMNGFFSDACIHNPTAKVLTDLKISNCTLTNNKTGQHSIELVSACTGTAKGNLMVADNFATTIEPGSLYCFECYSNASADKNGRLNPVVET